MRDGPGTARPREPGGRRIEIAVSRFRATGDRTGAILVNPGGPGQQGVAMPRHPAASKAGGLNVRAPLTRATLLAALDGAGWRVEQIADADTSALQDADWEISIALKEAPDGLAKELLRQTARESGNVPLPAYALTAR